MILIWGKGLYGKVDEVPGLFYVATQFGHLWYIPLVPTGSYLVLGKDGERWQGVKVSFSFKSFAIAWLRALGILAVLVCGLMTAILATDNQPFAVPLIVAAVALAVVVATYVVKKITRPSYERAHALGELAGLNERGRIMLDLAYGVITDREAEEAIANFDAIEAEAEQAANEARRQAQVALTQSSQDE